MLCEGVEERKRKEEEEGRKEGMTHVGPPKGQGHHGDRGRAVISLFPMPDWIEFGLNWMKGLLLEMRPVRAAKEG